MAWKKNGRRLNYKVSTVNHLEEYLEEYLCLRSALRSEL